MSRFCDWYVSNQLKNMGWPRPKGLLRTLKVETTVVDITVQGAVQIHVGLGAGSPDLAVRVLADSFERNPWTADSTRSLLDLLMDGLGKLPQDTSVPPWEIICADAKMAPHGREIPWQDLGAPGIGVIWSRLSAHGLVWGLVHHTEMPEYFGRTKASYESVAREAVPQGLNVPLEYPWGTLEEFYSWCREMLGAFEAERGFLPQPPLALQKAPEIDCRLG